MAGDCGFGFERQGYYENLYKRNRERLSKAVIVNGISPSSPLQQDLFDVDAGQIQKLRRLDAAIDRINKINGTNRRKIIFYMR